MSTGWIPEGLAQRCEAANEEEPEVPPPPLDNATVAAEMKKEGVQAPDLDKERAQELALVEKSKETTEIQYDESVFDEEMKKSDKKLAKLIAWSSTMKSINELFIADFCWKDVWARGVATRECKSGWYQGQSGLDSGLCYENCPSGFRRFGDHCWEDCPRNFNDLGAYCQREYWKDACENVWPFGRVCVKVPQIEAKDKEVKYLPGCAMTSDTCTQCPWGHYAHGWLCYKRPSWYGKSNYRCSGAELTCHRDCGGYLDVDCGGSGAIS